jgi:hypothetical protein
MGPTEDVEIAALNKVVRRLRQMRFIIARIEPQSSIGWN